MLLFKSLEEAILKHSAGNAFYIQDTHHTYAELAEKISGIRSSLGPLPVSEKNIGLVAHDDLETYAAIIAIWLEGRAYVPINPEMPADRNESMIRQSDIRTLFDSSEHPLFTGYTHIKGAPAHPAIGPPAIGLTPKTVPGEDLAYILFTSGSTGTPKGVQITRANLGSFIDSLLLLIPDVNEQDKFLQMFDLTFDLSIVSFLFAMLKGACIYTIPKTEVKYQYIFKLLDGHGLTFAVMVPGVLQYLSAYFDEILCPDLKYNLFCGEPLLTDITTAWSQCVPNAIILNVYGPTESTAFCTSYAFNRHSANKTYNGILSVGKPMPHTHILVIDQDNHPAGQGMLGELCLAGALTPGYLADEIKNKNSFFNIESGGTTERFYKTGDLCCVDEEGDIMFAGRLDSQVKIQGHRVELLEIEFHARTFLPNTNIISLTFSNASKMLEIGLFIEGEPFDTTQLVRYMKTKMPPYMIPSLIRFEKLFLYNSNGKIDRKNLSTQFQSL